MGGQPLLQQVPAQQPIEPYDTGVRWGPQTGPPGEAANQNLPKPAQPGLSDKLPKQNTWGYIRSRIKALAARRALAIAAANPEVAVAGGAAAVAGLGAVYVGDAMNLSAYGAFQQDFYNQYPGVAEPVGRTPILGFPFKVETRLVPAPASTQQTNVQVQARRGKCGDSGPYDKLDTAGDGSLARDHIPAKQSLLERAEQLNGGQALNPAQKAAIINNGFAINTPTTAHRAVSETYGGRVDPEGDAADLQKAANSNADRMEQDIDKYDPGCKDAYKKAADRIRGVTNAQYDEWLRGLLEANKTP
jgi:hypothetical protein